ncbi:MAG: hypothetical protein JXM68_02550, partial [Sedimentisphaerales bacterium]|nr:hypothetical protein [Sedimentisphaerales bacterium]
MKTTGLASSKAKGTQASRFTLETLESRTLLNADTIIYGIADMFFSEDALAQADSITEHEDHHDLESTYLAPMPALTGGYTLFLDFEPAIVYSRSGDFWLRQDSITMPGYDLSSYGWAGYEQESIEHILGFVSEDYAAYNVSVTATKPTSGQYTTIYVGGTADWYQTNSNIIGIASYDIGNRDASNYGFAFTEELSTYKSYAGSSVLKFSEYVANLISHEAAHTFGANHVDNAKYMMNPYLSTTYRTSGFGQGAIPDSTSSQDTQNLLGLNLGYKNTSDDYGDTASDPERISISSSNNTTINGILEHITDTDAFKFTASASGIFTADIDTTIYGNLDSTLTIYDAAGIIIHSNNNTTQGKDSLISFEVTQGQEYTVLVSSANRETSGTYQLTLTAPAGTPEISISDSSAVADDSYIDFGNIYINDTTSHTITITNSGSDTLTINNIVTSGNFDYTRET